MIGSEFGQKCVVLTHFFSYLSFLLLFSRNALYLSDSAKDVVLYRHCKKSLELRFITFDLSFSSAVNSARAAELLALMMRVSARGVSGRHKCFYKLYFLRQTLYSGLWFIQLDSRRLSLQWPVHLYCTLQVCYDKFLNVRQWNHSLNTWWLWGT